MRKYELSINSKSYTVDVKEFTAESAVLEVNGKEYVVDVHDVINKQSKAPAKRPAPVRKAAPAPAATPKPAASGGAGAITAPIPGSIMEIFVKVGDTVTEGQKLLKMEAMKMENVINSTIAGTVTAVSVAPGATVSQGQELVVIG